MCQERLGSVKLALQPGHMDLVAIMVTEGGSNKNVALYTSRTLLINPSV